ncbi:DUF6445 family protein [Povalibacter sp.]|uniref:DUF6445 family protein n=1 Tax=Povalibacter sp. TaxID=1962978 RepID=UPI002F3EE932
MQHRVDYIGNGRAPVLVIDNARPDAQALIEVAAARTDYSVRSLYYPGVRSSAPPEYAHSTVTRLRDLIRTTFDLAGELVITDSTFSLVVTPPDKLLPFQRVPHFDSADQNRIAVLHYLCDLGGTSFYRHRSTGTEIVTADMQERYMRSVNAEVRTVGMPPAQYVDGDTPLFERIARYDAVFNRMLVYRGSMLHSVNVARGFVPDANPRTGRLSINTFLAAKMQA